MDVKLEISQKIKFSDFSKTLERISTAPLAKKPMILTRFINYFNELANFLKGQAPEAETSFFPILRLLVPKADRERDAYGIKVPTMAKLYVKVLGIDARSEEAKLLTATNYDDYSTVVHDVMVKRAVKECSLSLRDVNQHLDAMAQAHQNNSRKQIEDELIKLISKLTALDQKWLIRIILKDLRLGLGQSKIFSIYHPLAKEFHARQAHLSSVCKSVESGETLPDDQTLALEVCPFQPVKPMLCQRINFQLIEPLIADKVFYLETKFDGERFQLHMRDEEYKYFSRNCFEYTETFGANFKSGTLTPLLPALFRKKVTSIILDGEMMVWNVVEKIYHTKSENYDAKSLRGNSNLRAAYCAYDILYFNGKSLIGLPYGERCRLLDTLFDDHPGVLVKSKRTKLTSNAQFQQLLNTAIDTKEEGVVIKAEDSVYKAGDRNAGWYKIKPDYIDGFICDFDCLIIGGYYNRKRTFISRYLVGVMADSTAGAEKFYSIASVASGLTMAESRDLNESLKPHWHVVNSTRIGRKTVSQMPPCLEWTDSDVPDVWIEPKNSIVLEIKASELVKSSTSRTESTLRFPRITRIRSDKPWNECMTLEELSKMCNPASTVSKLTTRHVNAGDMAATKKSPGKRTRKPALVAAPFKFTIDQTEDYTPIDTICAGLNFCVMSTKKGDYPTVAALKRKIQSHGGNIVENPGPTTFAIVAGDLTFLVQKLVASKKYDIVSVDWVLRALSDGPAQKRLKSFQPHEMIAMTRDTEETLAQLYDEFGDSYADKTSPEQLKQLFGRMESVNLPKLSMDEIIELEDAIYGKNKSPNIFRTMVAYFPNAERRLEITEYQLSVLMFRSKGGTVTYSTDGVTHIIVDRDADNSDISAGSEDIKVVDYHFILDSAAAEPSQLLDESSYLVKV